MFRVTAEAGTQIRHAAAAADTANMALRVAAKRGADGEIEYAIGFDEGGENDTEFFAGGVRILISPLSAALLENIELDYVELTPGEWNFIFVPDGVGAAPPATGGQRGGVIASGDAGQTKK